MAVPVREVLILMYFPYAYDVLYATFLISGSVLLYGVYRHLGRYGIGLFDVLKAVLKDLRVKLSRFVKFGLGQRRVLQDSGGGLMHGSLFYGFLVLLAYTTIIFIQDDVLPLFTSYTFLQGNTYLTLELLGDTFGVAYIFGLAIAVYRRFIKKLDKLETVLDDYFVVGMLIWIGISGFFIEALRLIIQPVAWADFSPVGDALSGAIGAIPGLVSNAPTLYQVFWWAHVFSVMFLIAAVPYTKLMHVFTSGANVALAPVNPMGKLPTPFNLQTMMENGSTDFPPNVRGAQDFQPLQRLALEACTNCGRCQEVCPAHASGRDLSPRLVVRDLASQNATQPLGDALTLGTIREPELWACTMCNACVSVCPVFIDQVDYITEFRRTLVAESKLDGRKKMFLENVGRSGNPFGLPQHDRMDWLTKLGVPTITENPGAEYLYWLGCQSSYDPRSREVAKAMVKLLKAANVSFAVLGNEEVCTGEPVRRMGEEGRFQELVMKNVETLKGHNVKKILVHCAHCFNTFKNEYPEFGGEFEIVHHSQLLSKLALDGRLPKVAMAGSVTFHDPCNLGRINGVIEEPRTALRSLQGLDLREMRRTREASFCCGGGGANVWYEVQEKKKIGIIRVEEARATGAETLAVACPFCITMFEDATKALGDETMKVLDIAEIMAKSLDGQS
ncbi:MAG TPA: heterodisulfide reductase-related iron-sulfur binding cluster [Nitrososphaerales archaeon]|nr:heterodisulfide reductase-related iron-sulfur binding cluster [Nitrososphaerales archaeon]